MPRPVAILKAHDLAATIRWYTAVGFTLTGREPEDDPTWCELERDGTTLQFLAGETPWPAAPAFTGTIYVYPESVRATYDAVAGVATPEWGVEERDWGARELVVQDPDGYFLTFTEPL